MKKDSYKFDDLVSIMKILRKECMWDKEQTHKSIRKNFLEEVYEACEAIDDENVELLKEELGDVLLQVVFHAEMENEIESFNIDDVCDGICKKLIYRHPHIFSDVKVSSTEDILANWDALKKVEKSQKSSKEAVASVAKSLPALMRAEKILKKAKKEGLEDLKTKDLETLTKEFIDESITHEQFVFEILKDYLAENEDFEDKMQKICENYIEKL